MDYDQQDFDNVAWDKNDELWEKTQRRLRVGDACRRAEVFVEAMLGKHATLEPPLMAGAYNIIYKMALEDSDGDVVILRLPWPDLSQFPDEKTTGEIAMMKYVQSRTDVPVPTVLHSGESSDLGPFIIMPFLQHKSNISVSLNDPDLPPGEPARLDPHVPEEKLEHLYLQMTDYLWQLSQHEFSSIGSLNTAEDGSFVVASRPVSVNMNNMLRLAAIPPSVLPPPNTTYKTADAWYVALAKMHCAQLVFQHNDLVYSEDDARNKYISRLLFLRLAREGKLSNFGFADENWSVQSKNLDPDRQSQLSPAPDNTNGFRIWCDDLRARNVLLKEGDDIAAIIDWEFSYIGPAQFSLDPPWWLLLETPDRWPDGIEAWAEAYVPRLETWIRCMEVIEERRGLSDRQRKMSRDLRESWDMGRFWMNYAARKSWAFDSVYWKFLDQRFFGKGQEGEKEKRWESRVGMLTDEEKERMERFVRRKMEESKSRILVHWESEDAQEALAEAFIDCA